MELILADIFFGDVSPWERLVLASWMVVTLVMLRSYAGTLMSLLAVRRIPQPYQDLRRVLDDPHVTMMWEAGSMYAQFLMVSCRYVCIYIHLTLTS